MLSLTHPTEVIEMKRNSWTILCLSYVVGLLSSSVSGFPSSHLSLQQLIIRVIGLGFVSVILSIVIPKFWQIGFKWNLWLAAAIVAIFAVFYVQLRIPQPASNDISYLFKDGNYNNQVVTVEGNIVRSPRLTRSQRVQFLLRVDKLKDNPNKSVQGKLYVTVPLLQGTGLYTSQKLAITGILYEPKLVSNPGSFDFKNYLYRQGVFAALKGAKVITNNDDKEQPWGVEKLRQRLIQAQIRWLGSPIGQLVSSMVMGRQAVDLPYDIQDTFIRAGLAHILAASGFQISVLLGTVITLTRRFRERSQFIIGLIILVVYISLTGFEPSILRAGIMGVGALIGLVTNRKVRQLGSLLLASTLLLLFNPLWIWDLSFQLSFLATFGLIVTMPVLETKLDFLPPTIANWIAVSLAASLWTLPLLLHVFSAISIYSIIVNIISNPLISIISLGGIISAAAALIFPVLGSAIAWLLYYPTHLLISLVEFFIKLPGSYLATGKISFFVVTLVYLLMIAVWLNIFCQKRWILIAGLAIILIVFPVYYNQFNLIQLTVLADKKETILVIQDQGKVILINGTYSDTVRYTIVPFLAQQGINQIDAAIAFGAKTSQLNGWTEMQNSVFIKHFLSNLSKETKETQILSIDESLLIGGTEIKLIDSNPAILQIKIQDKIWWLLAETQSIKMPGKSQKYNSKITPQVFLWTGKNIPIDWLKILYPKVAIANTYLETDNIQQQLQKQKIKIYSTGDHGAIQWTPEAGFKAFLEANAN